MLRSVKLDSRLRENLKTTPHALLSCCSSVEELSEQASPEKAGSEGGNQKSRRPELLTSNHPHAKDCYLIVLI